MIEKVTREHAIDKNVLHRRLRDWVVATVGDESIDPILGPPELVCGHLGNTPWVHVVNGTQLFCLHADVRRSAVVKYLELVDRYGDGLDWTVVKSQRGNMTAVAHGPDQIRLKPFYLYALKTKTRERQS